MSTTEVALDFFTSIFGSNEGYVCIASTQPPARRDTFREYYFEWPKEQENMLDVIERLSPDHNMYYCVNMLSLNKRLKTNALPMNLVWADLDTCRPDQLQIPPQIVIESSPSRYQALWRLDKKVDPRVAEDYSKRIAYQYAELGADKSGFDLTQLLRVPGTYNFKYEHDYESPNVRLITNIEKELSVGIFDALPPADDIPLEDIVDMPEVDNLPAPDSIIYAYQDKLKQTAFVRYYSEEPNVDWSKSLWRLINTCIEVGMTAEETFSVAIHSKCNKYERDGRPYSHLWREVLKAELLHKNIQVVLQENQTLVMPQLIASEDERTETIIDTYKAWATTTTDAVEEFHELSSAILLSTLMAKTLRLHSNLPFKLIPNLWGMILGDSTLSRKTTAMDMAMDFVGDIDRELVIATDASAEGMVTALENRPGMVSVFFRDEITGLFEAMNKKDYLAALPEILTKMYDVPTFYTRQLAKKTITVTNPIFIFFGGGILDRTYTLIDEQYFLSGFLPRFLVVNGRADIERVRSTGPPQATDESRRTILLSTFAALYDHYSRDEIQVPMAGQMVSVQPEVEVTLTEDAWSRFADMEHTLIRAADQSSYKDRAMPSFQRMAFSMLKLSMLLAGARDTYETVVVEEQDLVNAAYYIQRWGRHYVDMIRHAGQTKDETILTQVYNTVQSVPGILRGQVMQRHHLNKRNMDDIQDTLEQRYMIQVEKKGRATKYWPIGK